MWEKLLELLKNNSVSEAMEVITIMQPDQFELAVEIHTGEMDIYDAQMTRKKFSRIADTIAGHHKGRDGNAWRNTAFNLDPTSGNSSVARSYNR